MDETPVVICFLRHESDVLLMCRSEAVGSYQGRWGAVAGHVDSDPDGAAREEIREETGLDPADDVTHARRGEPFPVEDRDLDTRWIVHPFLFDAERRTVEPNEETSEFAWVPPTEILRRETVPALWTSYDRVRPTVETVREDTEHGSAYISLRALEVLRDEAALVATGRSGRDWEALETLTWNLAEARPAMPVVTNRVDRTMASASEDATVDALETAAESGIDRALAADEEAASLAAERIEGKRVATLSRSGTVRQALVEGEPDAVLVAESRPGGEGIGVAEDLTNSLEGIVTLTSDAGLAHQLVRLDADVLLVGADAILSDGRVVNKVGTRNAGLASSYEGIDVVVVAASDKISPRDEVHFDERDPAELYDGEAGLAVADPTFDVTPAEVIDVVSTERGILDTDDVAAVADELRSLATWRADENAEN